jgi:predicted TIM-barrel fold metal-dependent hydrolase
MKKHNVDICVVNPPYRIPSRLIAANFELSETIQHYQDKLIGFAWLDPRIEDSCQALEVLVKKHNFRGLKLHPVLNGYYPSNKVILPLIETAIKLSVPIYIHTGFGYLGRVEHLNSIITSYPEAKIVIGHMIEDGCIDTAGRSENVFIETSFTTYQKGLEAGLKKIEKAVKVLGGEKLLHGSDWPMGEGMEFEISKIKRARIKEETRSQILGKNARKLLHLEK